MAKVPFSSKLKKENYLISMRGRATKHIREVKERFTMKRSCEILEYAIPPKPYIYLKILNSPNPTGYAINVTTNINGNVK